MRSRILILRPEPNASRAVQALRRAGYRAAAAPPLRLMPPQDQLDARASVRQTLEHADWLVWPSASAVSFTLSLAGAIEPNRYRVAVPGPTSAGAARAAGFSRVIAPEREFTSEALLALPAMQDMIGCRVAIFSAPGGRDLIGKTLARRGAQVKTLTVYRREAVPPPPILAAGAAPDERLISVVSSAAGLDVVVRDWPDALRQSILAGSVWVPSRRVADRARRAGAREVVEIPAARLGDLPTLFEEAGVPPSGDS